ncbi:MAG: HAMP domain-containing protein [Deltaproteobacteria bacterium]|nr:HAMP domain-containing protein [Deltaproteobacteria bacterium]
MRLPTVVGLAAACSALLLAGAGHLWLAHERQMQDNLHEALALRDQAGRAALDALDEAAAEVEAARADLWRARGEAAERRASELVLLAADGHVPPPGLAPRGEERLGWIDLGADRLALGTTTATLSAQHPELAAALRAAPADSRGPLVIRGAGGVFGIGAKGPRRALAWVPLAAPPAAPSALRDARAVVGNLAAPSPPAWPLLHPAPIAGAVALLVALLAALWAALRLSRPLSDTAEAARAFVHGDPGVRADEERGGREARELARTVNQLIERAVRLEDRGRAAREEDIQAAALAIEQLGTGDLRQLTPRLAAPFGPLSRALDRARRDLLARVSRLHGVAEAVATHAVDMTPAARRLEGATRTQREALDRLAQSAAEAERNVLEGADRLEDAVAAAEEAALEQRRVAQHLKTALLQVSRRAGDVGAATQRVDQLLQSAQVLEQGLNLLASLSSAPAGEGRDGARGLALAGEGRAAFGQISRTLAEVRQDLRALADALTQLADSVVDPPPDAAHRARAPLYEAASSLVRAAELTGQGLQGWARATRQLGQDAGAVAEGAAAAGAHVGPLAEALTELRVGEAFEEVLLERLERTRREVARAEGDAELTEEGQALLDGVEAAAAAAQARIQRLIQATEATLEVLRR